MNPVRAAALAASRLYLEAEKDRTLTQCIAIAAKERGVEWKAVANYLTGVGARAMLANRELAETLDAVKKVIEPIAECDDGIVDMMSRDGETPWRLTAGIIWDASEAMGLLRVYED